MSCAFAAFGVHLYSVHSYSPAIRCRIKRYSSVNIFKTEYYVWFLFIFYMENGNFKSDTLFY